MKLSKRTALLSISVLLSVVGVTVCGFLGFGPFGRGENPSATRLIDLARAVPTPATDRLIHALQQRLRAGSKGAESLAQLGNAYLQKVRETADPSYYGKAEQVLQSALKRDPANADALTALGSLCLARHDFRAALEWGRKASSANPYKAAALGVAGDACIELGRYDEAVAAVQKMVDLRPDLSSYSRVSYVRELMGDIPGAIAAMHMAVQAGAPALENTNWCRVQLGNLFLNTGRVDEAEVHYAEALSGAHDFAPAQFGMARVLVARGRLHDAIVTLRRIITILPLPEYVIELGDLLAATGAWEEAKQHYALVQAIHRLYVANGVITDAELAMFMADHDLDLDQALKHARAAMQARPSISAADVLAWTLYKTGQHEEAAAFATQALRLGTRNALVFFHAGMIRHGLGDDASALHFLRKALQINPHFSVRYSPVAEQLVSELTAGLHRVDSTATHSSAPNLRATGSTF